MRNRRDTIRALTHLRTLNEHGLWEYIADCAVTLANADMSWAYSAERPYDESIHDFKGRVAESIRLAWKVVAERRKAANK